MRFLCTIYTHDYSMTNNGTTGKGGISTEPSFDNPVVQVVVGGSTHREAAARAYVRAVGRKRARWMRQQAWGKEEVAAQETSRKAIAASLRKTMRRIGECFELDHLVQAWLIKVEPVPASLQNLPAPRRLHLPPATLLQFGRSPFPN